MRNSDRLSIIPIVGVTALAIFGSVWFWSKEGIEPVPAAPSIDSGVLDPHPEPAAVAPPAITKKPVAYLTHAAGDEITEDNIFIRVNNERAVAGLPPLIRNPKLDDAAQEKLEDMLDRDYFAHDTPDGQPTWIWFVKAGYAYTVAGENLARNFDTASATVAGWMASPTHKANILKEKYTETGVAVSGSIVVQEFGKPQ